MKYCAILTIFLLQINTIIYPQTAEQLDKKIQQVQQYIKEENFSQGISLLNVLLRENPNDTTIYQTYAELLLELNQFDQALSTIQKAILLSQNTPENYIIVGNIYSKKGDYTNAKASYEKAIKISPGIANIYYEYANLNLKNFHIQEAERLLKISCNFNPNSWQNIILTGKITYHKGQIKEAKDIFFQAVNLFPYEEKVLDEFANFLLYLQEFPKAITVLKEANQRFGNSSSRNKLIGDVFFKDGVYEKALQYYLLTDQSYRNLSFANMSALKWKIYKLYIITENLEEAYNYLKQAFELQPQNQLYISAFYNYLTTENDNPVRPVFTRYLEKLANAESKKGRGLYYLSLIQKILNLDPGNTKARDELISYAKINNDEFAVENLLTLNKPYQTNNTSFNNTLQLRKHLQKTKRLDTNKKNIYQYTNKIYIQDKFQCFTDNIKQEIILLEGFFPSITSVIDTENDFGEESRSLFQNNTNFNIVTHMVLNEENSKLDITIYDKTGFPIRKIEKFYTTEFLTKNLINYIQTITNTLPHIGYLTKRLPNSTYRISLGTKQNIKANDTLAIVDKDFFPVSTATVTEVFSDTATVKQNNIVYFDNSSSFILPVEYVPSLLSNTNANNPIINTNYITNINQVSQKHYSQTIDLSKEF